MKLTPTEYDRAWAESARAQFPHLTSYGYGLPDGCNDNWTETLSDDDVEIIITARDFLSGFKPVKKVSYGSSISYPSPTAMNLKDLLKNYKGTYVYEGAITLAASALGLPIRNWATHHAQIGVSRKQYKALQDVVDYKRTHRAQ
jgi:hypothetical protein